MRTSVLLGYKEESVFLRDNKNECLAQGQCERVSCSGTRRKVSLSGTIRTSVLLKDNANECLARVQGGKCLYQGQ